MLIENRSAFIIMSRLSAIVIIMVLGSQINGAVYDINAGAGYLTSTPSSAVACKSVPNQFLTLNSSYFSTIGKSAGYYTTQQFSAYDSSGRVIDPSGYASASTITANSYSGLATGSLFAFGSSSTLFTMVYNSPSFTTPVVMSDTRTLNTSYMSDFYNLNYSMNITKNNFSISSAYTAGSVVGANTCLTINFTNPCAYLVPTTVFKIYLPPAGGYSPFSVFNLITCNISLNGVSPSGRTCSGFANEITFTGMVTSYMSTSSLSIVLCDIIKTNTVPNGSRIRLENSNYSGTAAVYGETLFNY